MIVSVVGRLGFTPLILSHNDVPVLLLDAPAIAVRSVGSGSPIYSWEATTAGVDDEVVPPLSCCRVVEGSALV